MKRNILFIHQSSELYGSDKTLYFLVKELKNKSGYTPIVILPEQGPLQFLLEQENIEVIILDVVKVSRAIFKPSKLFSLPSKIVKQTKTLHKKLKGRQIQIVHSNTIAVLLGAFYAKRFKIKHIWHIHEIIIKPKIVSKLFSYLIYYMSKVVVYNSKATKNFWVSKNNSLKNISRVILNGLDRNDSSTSINDIRNIRSIMFGAKETDVIFALVGRINLWKGQQFLLEVFYELRKSHHNIKLIFVGSTFQGMEYLKEDLEENIQTLELTNSCKIIPFQNNIWEIWDSIDVAIVPSLEPEPFGLVAVEAMLAKKPVVAAEHGGLVEIVKDRQTGYFFEPLSKQSLFEKLNLILNHKNKIKEMGDLAYEEAIQRFSMKRYVNDFLLAYKSI